jgi:hypothetical protein
MSWSSDGRWLASYGWQGSYTSALTFYEYDWMTVKRRGGGENWDGQWLGDSTFLYTERRSFSAGPNAGEEYTDDLVAWDVETMTREVLWSLRDHIDRVRQDSAQEGVLGISWFVPPKF